MRLQNFTTSTGWAQYKHTKPVVGTIALKCPLPSLAEFPCLMWARNRACLLPRTDKRLGLCQEQGLFSSQNRHETRVVLGIRPVFSPEQTRDCRAVHFATLFTLNKTTLHIYLQNMDVIFKFAYSLTHFASMDHLLLTQAKYCKYII